MFQSRRFWFSYRLRVVGEDAEDEEAEVIIEFVLVVVVMTMLVVSRSGQEFTSCWLPEEFMFIISCCFLVELVMFRMDQE